VPNRGGGGYGGGGDDSHFVFRQKLLVEDGSVGRGGVRVKQSGLFSPKFGETSSHVFTQSPQNVAVEPGIHSLACWDKLFALPQLLYENIWRNILDNTSQNVVVVGTTTVILISSITLSHACLVTCVDTSHPSLLTLSFCSC
jgi:hypothetical protein